MISTEDVRRCLEIEPSAEGGQTTLHLEAGVGATEKYMEF